MLSYSSRLLRLAPARIKSKPKGFRAQSNAVGSRYADKIQQHLAECVPTVQRERLTNLQNDFRQGFTDIEQYKDHIRSSTPHPRPGEPGPVTPSRVASTNATNPLTERKDSPPVLVCHPFFVPACRKYQLIHAFSHSQKSWTSQKS